MPSQILFFDTNEHVRSAKDLSPPTADNYTNKSTTGKLFNEAGGVVGDMSIHFTGTPIAGGTSRSRAGNFNINITNPFFNIILPFSSIGKFPNTVEPLNLTGPDFSGVITKVVFEKINQYVKVTISQ